MLPATVYYDNKQHLFEPFPLVPNFPIWYSARQPCPSFNPTIPPPLPTLSPSHEIILVEPLLVAPAPLGHEILIPPLPPLLLLPPLPRHPVRLLLPPLVLGPLRRPLPRQVRLLVGGQVVDGARPARLVQPVDRRVEAGGDEGFFGLLGLGLVSGLDRTGVGWIAGGVWCSVV